MQRIAILLTSTGIFFLLMSLTGSFMVAQGSRGHWGYVIAVKDEQAEVVLPPAQDGPAIQPTPSPMASTTEAPAQFGEEIVIPLDNTPVATSTAPDQSRQQEEMPELRPGVSYVPEKIEIPAIGLDAPIEAAKSQIVQIQGKLFEQWLPPAEFAAGWHASTATLGLPGNTVLNGHNNIYGGVFDRLRDLKAGDRIYVTAQELIFVYEITNVMNLPEKYEKLETRIANAQWLQPSQDERLTLVTCWPPNHNTNRLIVVAKPVERIDWEVSRHPREAQ